MNRNTIFSAVAALLIGAACTPDESTPTPAPNAAQFGEEFMVNDLPADTGQPRQPASGRYTFFSFENGIIDRADSATNKWDIAFQMTNIRLNSGASGPGTVQGQLLEGLYDEMNTFPENGYASDTENALALGTGSGSWYTYDQDNHVLFPTPGKFIALQLNESTWVKMEILSYYKGAPAAPTLEDPARYYTFRYQIFTA